MTMFSAKLQSPCHSWIP